MIKRCRDKHIICVAWDALTSGDIHMDDGSIDSLYHELKPSRFLLVNWRLDSWKHLRHLATIECMLNTVHELTNAARNRRFIPLLRGSFCRQLTIGFNDCTDTHTCHCEDWALEANVVTCNAAMSVCEKGKQWSLWLKSRKLRLCSGWCRACTATLCYTESNSGTIVFEMELCRETAWCKSTQHSAPAQWRPKNDRCSSPLEFSIMHAWWVAGRTASWDQKAELDAKAESTCTISGVPQPRPGVKR